MLNETPVLLVDDDTRLLNAAKRILRKEINLHTAASGAAALQTLEEGSPYSVIVSDQNMPEMCGTAFLEEASKRWPMTVRIMLTGNNDTETAVSAVNNGRIFRFLNKPCQPEDVLAAIRDGQRQYDLLANEKSLLEGTLSGSVKVLVDVLALSNPVAFQNAVKVRIYAKRLSAHMNLTRLWQLDIAAMLWPLGNISLPVEVTTKIASKETLSAKEQTLVEKTPQSARDLISNIPRMETIAEAIYYSAKGYDGSGFPADGFAGAEIPEHARILRALIDLVHTMTTTRCSERAALDNLETTSHLYDPAILSALRQIIQEGEDAGNKDDSIEIQAIPPAELQEGDILVEDIVHTDGHLLLSAGNEITRLMISRLKNMDELNLLVDLIHIKRMDVKRITL